jgi:hypothetical protein
MYFDKTHLDISSLVECIVDFCVALVEFECIAMTFQLLI